MYRHCLFCHTAFGENRDIEEFPFGERMAFHAARGHLWVVCGRCGQWNLVPLDRRWEAIESCRRLYAGAVRAVSTEEIGLARTPSGLELIAVGEPKRDEFAAWRYGSELTATWDAWRRRIRAGIVSGGALAAAAAVATNPLVVSASVAAFGVGSGLLIRRAVRSARSRRRVAAVPVEDEYWVRVSRRDLPDIRVEASYTRRSWSLRLIGDGDRHEIDELHEVGPEFGVPTLGLVMPAINRLGGRTRHIRTAISLVEEHRDPAALVYHTVKTMGHGKRHTVRQLPPVPRLALEIATQEESERRAARGELALLQRAWKEAEGLAEISDGLLDPPFVRAGLARLRRRSTPQG